jgi:hypothetical protein
MLCLYNQLQISFVDSCGNERNGIRFECSVGFVVEPNKVLLGSF